MADPVIQYNLTVTTDAQTRVLEAGDANAEPVVLVHDGAFGSDAHLCWGPLIEALSPHYRVVAPDLLGYGGTAKVVDFAVSPYQAKTDHLAQVCRHLGIQRAHFVGSSFGGTLLINAALSDALPMRTLASISGSGGVYRNQEAFSDLQNVTCTEDDARRLTGYLVEDLSDLKDHIRLRNRNMMLPGHWEALESARLRNPATPVRQRANDYPDILGECDVPMLMIAGRSDPLMEDGWASRLAAFAKVGKAVTVSGRHSPQIDHVDEVASALFQFFAEHELV